MSISRLTVPLARRTLLYHRRRLLAALAGVTFAVVLANTQVGILSGFMANAVIFIDRLPADLWVMAPGTPNFDMCHGIPESHLQQVRSTPGVEWAEKMLVGWSTWKTGTGSTENTQVIGLPPGGKLDIPFRVEPAGAALTGIPGASIVDRTDCSRLMVSSPGEVAELTGKKVTVLGFTTGMRSFTTNPYVLMRFEDARESSLIDRPDSVSYVLVKAAPGANLDELRREIERRAPGTDVLTASEFSRRTIAYWLFGTGVGMAILLTAILGFVVGGAVVGQALYSLVQEQRAEFGVLKAMGAGHWLLCRVVAQQALLIAAGGSALGLLVTLAAEQVIRASGTPVLIGPGLMAYACCSVVAVCLAAAALPVFMILKIEPAVVFRG